MFLWPGGKDAPFRLTPRGRLRVKHHHNTYCKCSYNFADRSDSIKSVALVFRFRHTETYTCLFLAELTSSFSLCFSSRSSWRRRKVGIFHLLVLVLQTQAKRLFFLVILWKKCNFGSFLFLPRLDFIRVRSGQHEDQSLNTSHVFMEKKNSAS